MPVGNIVVVFIPFIDFVAIQEGKSVSIEIGKSVGFFPSNFKDLELTTKYGIWVPSFDVASNC